MPRRPSQHVLDTAAQRIFESSLPAEWVVRPQYPDYGIDYQCEIVDDLEVTAICFEVQLKGHNELAYENDHAKIRLATADLTNWEKRLLPVVVVAVDCSRKGVYWNSLDAFWPTFLRRGQAGVRSGLSQWRYRFLDDCRLAPMN